MSLKVDQTHQLAWKNSPGKIHVMEATLNGLQGKCDDQSPAFSLWVWRRQQPGLQRVSSTRDEAGKRSCWSRALGPTEQTLTLGSVRKLWDGSLTKIFRRGVAPMDTVAEIERSGSRPRGAGAGGRISQNLRKFFFAGGTIAVLVVVQSLRLASAEPVALSEPPNVGDAKFAAIAYYKSGAYERDLAAVASRVGARLAERAPQVSRAALVLDIDDTVLSNWEVIMADDFGRVFEGPCRSLQQ
jgi:hypothetical protein